MNVEKARAAVRKWTLRNMDRIRDTEFERRIRDLPDDLKEIRREILLTKRWLKGAG
jgi:hypothetical protein